MQLDASGDAAAQVGPSGLSGSAGWSGADQGFSGHLDRILPLHQREQAPGSSGSQGISQEQVLQHQGIAGLEGRTAGKRRLLLAAGSGSVEATSGTAENPTPNGRPQRCGKDARRRKAHGPILDTAREVAPMPPLRLKGLSPLSCRHCLW